MHPDSARDNPENLPDLLIFARAYFRTDLTRAQIKAIKAIANGNLYALGSSRRNAATADALKILKAYIAEGLKPSGRKRLPQYYIPRNERMKGITQEGKVLALIKRPGGAFIFELSKIALKYDSRIHNLRQDGHNIIAERQYNKNGKASNTFRYYLIGEDETWQEQKQAASQQLKLIN